MQVRPPNIYLKTVFRKTVTGWRYTFAILTMLLSGVTRAQSIEEIIVSVNVQRIGFTEMPALIRNETVFLPVNLLLDYIKIKNKLSPDFQSDEGFFIDPKSRFLIDKKRSRITYKNVIFKLNADDLIQSGSNLYLRSDYWGNIFGLECAYSFRDLTITVSTKLELPALAELRQEQMRQNLNRLKGETKVDTTIRDSHPMFSLGNADWVVSAVHETHAKSITNLNLDIGAIVAGGETDLYLKYTTNTALKYKDQFYRWRYVNNENSVLRQVTLGKILTQSTSSIYAPITGVQLTNMSTSNRKSFGTYRLSDKTDAGSLVELYVNNVLVDYTKADGSGFYSFDIPLVYGTSTIKLRFYGISGEDRSREQYISIPFNFIPLRELEYNFVAGFTDDSSKSKFVRGVVNYGLAKTITLGGGIEYLSGIESRKFMPFLSASLQASSNLLISEEYTYGVRSRSIINYRHRSNVEVNISYTKNVKGQMAIKNSYVEEKKALVSMPFHSKYLKGLARLTVNQVKYSLYKTTYAEFLLSGALFGISSNFTTTAQISQTYKQVSKTSVYSNISFVLRLPKSLRITPQVKFDYDILHVSAIKCELEKKLFTKGYINFSYEKIIQTRDQYLSLGLRYNFSFAQTSMSAKQNRSKSTTSFSARGNILYDNKTRSVETGNQAGLGKGGIIIQPFLDINCNGLKDANEPKVPGLNFHVNGGHTQRNNRDTTIHIAGLTSYSNCIIEFENNFDNIAWQIIKKKISVFIEPNHQTFVQIPIAVIGEVSGVVSFKGVRTESARFPILLFNSNAIQVAKTLTDTNGSFTFIGLAPGKYTARVDAEGFKMIQRSSPEIISFTILPNKEGDVVSGLKFILEPLRE